MDMDAGAGTGTSSSSSPVPPESKLVEEIFERLAACQETCRNLQFRETLEAHLARFPPRYALEISLARVEDVLLHQHVLVLAPNSDEPAFAVQLVEDRISEGAGPVYEVIFATVDKPQLHNQLSDLLSGIGLNIREARWFSTMDDYSLDIFVVDALTIGDTQSLSDAVERAIAESKAAEEQGQVNLTPNNPGPPNTPGDVEENMRSACGGDCSKCDFVCDPSHEW